MAAGAVAGRQIVTKRRILCIEDHPEMIDLIRLILERRGLRSRGPSEARRDSRPCGAILLTWYCSIS